MRLVPKTDANILPIIRNYIASGTAIWSDEWATYKGIAGKNFVQKVGEDRIERNEIALSQLTDTDEFNKN